MKKEEKKDNTQKARKGKEQGIEYFQDPKNYVNRELSWLEFDCRGRYHAGARFRGKPEGA